MRVLIVDDCEQDRKLLSTVLKEIDRCIEIESVAGLAAARKVILDKVFDLIFLDIRMNVGDDDGIIFLDEIRKSEHEAVKSARVVIISGIANRLDIMTGNVLRAEAIINKTIELSELRQSIRRIVSAPNQKKEK